MVPQKACNGDICPSEVLYPCKRTWLSGAYRHGLGRFVRDLSKQEKASLLRALSKKLERARLNRNWIQRILHARVPILKFEWAGSGGQTYEGNHCQTNIYSLCGPAGAAMTSLLGDTGIVDIWR